MECLFCRAEIFYIGGSEKHALDVESSLRWVKDLDGVWRIRNTYVSHVVRCPASEFKRKTKKTESELESDRIMKIIQDDYPIRNNHEILHGSKKTV